MIADCAALVNADLADWIEGDGGLLSDGEMEELGTLPLGELHRRHERGEL